MSANSPQPPDSQAATERALAIKRLYASQLMSKANVVGVGVGFTKRGGAPTDQVGLVVMVERKLPAAQLSPSDMIPSEIEGVPVDVQEVGEIRAY
jgi:hypothetical protein